MKISTNKKELKALNACAEGYETFIKAHGDKEVNFSDCIDSNSWDDVWWLISEIQNQLSENQLYDLRVFGCNKALINIEKIKPCCSNDDYELIVNYLSNPIEPARSAARSAAESAAWSAARSAAESAAWSAESAAESAAWSAARSAAWSAARSAWSAESAAESARSAAESAAWSAESAAWSAARSAAWSAARSAWSAESAAESARSAARSAAMKEFTQELKQLFLKWEEINERILLQRLHEVGTQ